MSNKRQVYLDFHLTWLISSHSEHPLYSFQTVVWVLLRPTKTSKVNKLGDGNYGFSCSSKKIRKSNCLQMSLQRQHFLLSYLTILSVGPARV